MQRLTNGSYTTCISPTGSGVSSANNSALTRYLPHYDEGGFYIFVRDLNRERTWSTTRQPVPASPERYECEQGSGRATFLRHDDGIETKTEMIVALADDVELRRVTLTNLSEETRRLDLTSYAEVVLAPPAADAGHPAFSKLFVQTEWLPEHSALLARRRRRSPDEPTLWLMHTLVGANHLEFETDRMRFIGRGRSLAHPRALDPQASLTGTTGNVLDPLVSLRTRITLAPGESVQFTFVIGAAPTREAVVELAKRYHAAEAIAEAFDAVASANAIRYEPAQAASSAESFTDPATLRFFNGYGGFTETGDEYVLLLPPDGNDLKLPPMPWTNVVANESFGFLTTERGGGTTWNGNSRLHRLTPWLNDPVSDPHTEAFYLRDEDAGVFWSPQPGPVPGPGGYEVRHGFGYTRWRHRSHGLAQETTQFVPRHAPVKITHLRLQNTTDQLRRLAFFAYAEWVLGEALDASGVQTEVDAETGAVLATNPQAGPFAGNVAFAVPVVADGAAFPFTTDRASFTGPEGDLSLPRALQTAQPLDGRAGGTCAAFSVEVELAPGEEKTIIFLLGEAGSREAAQALIRQYGQTGAVTEALDDIRGFWKETLSAVQIETPAEEINLMVNGWLLYQVLVCRIWGRSALYQSGGAFGFRDQLQDASALVYTRPDLTRQQILLHAAHQFVEGDVLHWWHPPDSRGIRTRFADDLLWLPYITAFYLKTTGDYSVLEEDAPFLTTRALEEGEDEAYLLSEVSGETASVYEHCCRALDRSLTRGAHGLPLMGTGDWNDGMNRVGREGRGESVWLGFFLYDILRDFIPICESKGDQARVEAYTQYRRHLYDTLNDTGWDGAWYRRAYYDNGAVLGSAESDEAQIDALAQAWAVISKAAPPERARQAMDAMTERLVDEEHQLIRLLTPAFDKTPDDPGYIKGYIPGVRENGGQYTHAALWAVRALAEIGRATDAARLLAMLSPVAHARTPEEVAVYQVEPYVIAADVYGEPPHVGRGGWTWYTGSAGWMYRVTLESVLGFSLEGDTLELRPRLPQHWPGFTLRYRLPNSQTTYEIRVTSDETQETTLTVDGEIVVSDRLRIPLRDDGATHTIALMLGQTELVYET